MSKCPYIKDNKCDLAKCDEFHIRADERAKVIEELRMEKFIVDFNIEQCDKKDGRYYLDITEMFNFFINAISNK